MTTDHQPNNGTEPAIGTDARAIDASPFCWCAKPALRRIREALDDEPYLDQALAVYLCHCERASDEQNATYTVTRRRIAERAGVSIRRVAEIHSRLKGMKLLHWTQNHIAGGKELSASTYTLLGLGTPRTTLGTPSTRLGTNAKRHLCTVGEESIEESTEESIGRRPPRKRILSPSERISAEKEREEIATELKAIRNQASADAFGPMYDEVTLERRRELKERDRALSQAVKVEL